jgi:hypothetical protein
MEAVADIYAVSYQFIFSGQPVVSGGLRVSGVMAANQKKAT